MTGWRLRPPGPPTPGATPVDDFELDTAFQKPVIVSETGGAARQGVHGERLDAWSEELQAARQALRDGVDLGREALRREDTAHQADLQGFGSPGKYPFLLLSL